RVLSSSLRASHRPPSPRFPYPTLFRSDCKRQQVRVPEAPWGRYGQLPFGNSVFAGHLPFGVINLFNDALAGIDVGPSGIDACKGSEGHTSEFQSQSNLVCRLLVEKKND